MTKFESEQPVFNELIADVQLLRDPHTAIAGTNKARASRRCSFDGFAMARSPQKCRISGGRFNYWLKPLVR